ncbi:MAG: repeat containing protein [Candidatus Acidoferrum typicum]|nr:repeat containing protein [Candidatus Acidoferrum typicum]
MNNEKRQWFHRRLFLLRIAFFVALVATASICDAQNPPQLQIASPASGTIFNPGQTISVTVTSPANVSFTSVGVAGEDPFGLSALAASVPAQFSFTVPTNISFGQYMLTADGTAASGQSVESDPIFIDIERADLPAVLTPSMSSIVFAKPAQTVPLIVFAKFIDGTVLNVSRSSYVTYSSSNPSVATVDANGVVTALCAGTSSVKATYTLSGNSVQTSIPAQGPPSLVVSPSALGFKAQSVGSSSSPQTITVNNASNVAINVLGATTTGDFSQTNSCGSLQPGLTCGVDVTFVPTAVGVRTGSVQITNNSCQASLSISLTGTGMSDFSISATPTTQAVTVGASANYATSVTSIGGFTNAVVLSVSGLPSGATATFTPTSISGGSGSSKGKYVFENASGYVHINDKWHQWNLGPQPNGHPYSQP